MDNKAISRALKVFGQLMELHDQNIFKVRSVYNASFKVDKLPFPLAEKSITEIAGIDGIGKSIAAKIHELILTEKIVELEQLLEQTPAGVVELLSIKGLGPKKAQAIWRTLGIESTGELYYACNENRLIEAKGFGLKTQDEIRSALEFKMAGSGKFLYARVEDFALQLETRLKNENKGVLMAITGEFRRRCEIIRSLDLLIAEPALNAGTIISQTGLVLEDESGPTIRLKADNGLTINITLVRPENFYKELFLSTGNNEHVDEMLKKFNFHATAINSETEIYERAGMPYIEPELRECLFEFNLINAGKLPQLITVNDLKGSLHNHSTWSDGVNTLEEMALFCRDELQLSYFGISDHSKTAVYAKGLSEERVLAQQAEIDSLNAQLAPFRIFKGIESDILPDGSLDYSAEILATFDFVVASVHSAFKMDEERATARLVKAIENPYTTILGHPTGRLLLSRAGYPVDFKKIIDACAANEVVIEINANPLRLDIDWRWHQYAIEKGVLLSVNPDAHRTSGFYDMRYGVFAARKGGVSSINCLNAMSLPEISGFFEKKKSALIHPGT